MEGDDVTLAAARKRHVLAILERCGGNRSEAARRLVISRSTMNTLPKGWGLGEA